MIQHDPTSLYIKITTLIHLEYKRCDVWVEQVTWLNMALVVPHILSIV